MSSIGLMNRFGDFDFHALYFSIRPPPPLKWHLPQIPKKILG
jgi:hypothetical protein